MTPKSLFSGIFFLLCCAISLHAQSLQTGAGIAKYPLPLAEAVLPDSSFGGSSSNFKLVHAKMQADSSLLVWGYGAQEHWTRTWNDDNPSSPTVTDYNNLFSARFTAAGLLDTTYGHHGWVNYALPPELNERMSNIKIAQYPDGRCLVVADMNGQRDILAMRFQPDGRQDSTFREWGYVWFTADFSTRDRLLDLALLPNGKARLLLSSNYEKLSSDCRIVQLDAGGFRDTLFDVDGVLTVLDIPGIFGGHFLPDGRLVVLAYNMDWLSLYRYMPDGSPDYAFGHFGRVNTRIESIYDDFISVWPDGSLLVYGNESRFCESGKPGGKFNIRRYDSNGRIDTTFEWSAGEGWATTDYLRSLTILNDTTFSALHIGPNGGETLYYTATGKLRHVQTRQSDGYRDPWEIIPLAQHQQLLIGTDREQFIALRLLPDGKPDPAFGLDSVALRKAGYFFKKEEKASTIGFDLHPTPESIPPSTFLVVVLSDSSATPQYTTVALPVYYDKFTCSPAPRFVSSIEAAVRMANAGNNLDLQLSNHAFAARMPELAAIPADRLKGLHLINCRLDRIPAVLQQFADLELLEIRYDADSAGLMPSAKRLNALLALFPKLEILILALPGVPEAPKGLENLKNLTLLDLDLPGLQHFPEAICRMGSLTELHFRNVVHPITVPASIGDLANLEVLDVSGTGITAFPDSLARCVQLREINILTKGTFAAFPNDLLALPNLEKFRLEICQPSRELKMQIGQLRDISNRKNKWSIIRMYD